MALRSQVAAFLDRPAVTRFILAVILFNAVILGLETSKPIMAAAGTTILFLDKLCLAIFIVELVLKLFALGGRFFRSGWNIFDLAVVGVALLPASGGLSVLRALRVLRVLRVISIAPSLRRVVEGFLRALPGMGSVALLIGLIYYISAVMATKLFAASFPDWFGDLGRSAYSLFQIMTLESWSMGIVRPVMEVYPYAWAFFVPFILATTFAVMNLLVGLIVNSMQEAASAEHEEAERDKHAELLSRLDAIERRLSDRG
ncbi:MAG: ion transporter [Paracoccaceae bacterium]